MAFESPGSSLLPALPSCTASHQTSWAGGGAPGTFLSLTEMLLDFPEAEQVSSRTCCQSGVGVSYASSKIPWLQHIAPLQVTPQGSYWGGSVPPNHSFSAHHSSDHFSRDASLITSGAKEIRARKGKSSQGHSCKWCTAVCGIPSLSWERHSLAVYPPCCKASLWQSSSNQRCSADHGSHLRSLYELHNPHTHADVVCRALETMPARHLAPRPNLRDVELSRLIPNIHYFRI